MSPTDRSTEPDSQSEITRARGRPPLPLAQMLDAADALLRAGDGEPPTMDAVAQAAGVGKGTLFRAFGDRDGLFEALTAARFQTLRDSADRAGSPIGPGVPPRDRAVAFLDALLVFKFANRALMRAREGRGGGDLQSERYRWIRAFLRDRIVESLPRVEALEADYLSHALLAATRVDLLEALLGEGRKIEEIRREHARHVRAVLPEPATRDS